MGLNMYPDHYRHPDCLTKYWQIVQEEPEMLVLSRCKNDSIMIGDDVEIMIVKVQGNKVRLGIMAPRNITVNRKEIYLKIQEEKEWANLDLNKCK
jgi:carbon storage regulator